ncbi:MAG: hypothetical protein RM049_10800 [Nostoc sp. DedQUE04]|uniref:hypothetical protein n=1 Tax=Nostoc sp. DedQUE04 TaxID=3075390 RepID=UPI002AD3A339|nr:hypothetical protein [Nostoc sp. DedQUE04]MDZ8135775.1 hypothetical protein [Nostoc sp. DedQUE04]
MLEKFPNNQSPNIPEPLLKNTNLIDEAFGQGIITVNEYRLLLGLPIFVGGDVTLTKKSLVEQWKF